MGDSHKYTRTEAQTCSTHAQLQSHLEETHTSCPTHHQISTDTHTVL